MSRLYGISRSCDVYRFRTLGNQARFEKNQIFGLTKKLASEFMKIKRRNPEFGLWRHNGRYFLTNGW